MNFCHILRWEILPGGDSHWLLTVQPESLVGSTNGLNPTDLKCGRVGTEAPGGKTTPLVWRQTRVENLTESREVVNRTRDI